MVMIDNIISCYDRDVVTSFFIDEKNIFCKNGFFAEPGLVENIAQSAAAKIGFLTKPGEKEILLGYICSIKDLVINFLPPVNSIITTEIIVENELMGFTIISGKVMSGDNLACKCEMRIFAQEKK